MPYLSAIRVSRLLMALMDAAWIKFPGAVHRAKAKDALTVAVLKKENHNKLSLKKLSLTQRERGNRRNPKRA